MKTITLREPRDFGDIISDTFGYVRVHFKTLAKGLLLFSLPFIIISGILVGGSFGTIMSSAENPEALGELGGTVVQMFLGVFLLMMTFLFIIIIVMKHIQLVDEGVEHIDMGMLLDGVGRNIGGLIGILIITGIATTIGFFLFILPGIFIAVKLSLAPAIYVIEEEDFGEALSKSWELTKDNWWFTFGVSFVMSIIINIVSNIFIFPLYIIMSVVIFSSGEPNPESLGTMISLIYGFSMIVVGLFYCFPIISQAMVYFHLNEIKSGATLFDKIDSLGEN